MPRVKILNEDENFQLAAVAASLSQENLTLSPVDLSKQLFQTILRLKGKFVDGKGDGDGAKCHSGKVDYAQLLKTSEFSTFQQETRQIANVNLALVPNHNERKAFFLNTYNTLTIHALATSVTREQKTLELGSFWQSNAYQIGESVYSLDDIEHGILRCNKQHPSSKELLFRDGDPRMQFVQPHLDPRIHFALNCGAKSCPSLRWYTAGNIEKSLDIATQTFCQNDIVLELKDKRVILSQLFMWYGVDFGHEQKSVLEWVSKYLTENQVCYLQLLLTAEDFSVQYADYDWTIT